VNRFIASIPSPTVNNFQAGPFLIRFYALFIIVGIVLAIVASAIRLRNRGAKAGLAVDIAIWTVPFGIAGARLFHVLTHVNDYFGTGKNPLAMFYIWEGGLAIYGGLIFGAIGAYIGARMAGIKFFAYADALVPGLLVAQAVGRWGNFFNNELFGTPTNLPWGLEIPQSNAAYPVGLPAGQLFQPTFLYESLWSLLGIFVLLWAEKRFNLQWGKMFASYLIYYSFGRIFIESIRLDPAYVFLGLRTNVWSAIGGVVLGIALFWYQSRKHTGVELSIYLPGRAPVTHIETAEEAAADIEEALESSTDEVQSKSE
jgi:prolipoprotein diacylglyceryl transferase